MIRVDFEVATHPPELNSQSSYADLLQNQSPPSPALPWQELNRLIRSGSVGLSVSPDSVSDYALDAYYTYSDAVGVLDGVSIDRDGWVQYEGDAETVVDSLSLTLDADTVLNDGSDTVTASVRSENQTWDGYIVVSGTRFAETFEPTSDATEEITSTAPAGTVIEVQAISVGPVNSVVKQIEVQSA